MGKMGPLMGDDMWVSFSWGTNVPQSSYALQLSSPPALNVLGMVARDSPDPQKPKAVRRGNWGQGSFPYLQIGSLTREKVTEALECQL